MTTATATASANTTDSPHESERAGAIVLISRRNGTEDLPGIELGAKVA
jgi:hypothetical protein